MDLGKWGIPVNLIAVVMGALLVVNIGWPRQEVYDPAGDVAGSCSTSRLIFVALTLVVGLHRLPRGQGPRRRSR